MGLKTENVHRQSFTGAYLQQWCRFERTAVRHILILTFSALLVYFFGKVHGNWADMHQWNKATADASLVLLAMTLAIGPAARLIPSARKFLPFRREFGVYSVLWAVVHTVIILSGWVEWDMARLMGWTFHPRLGRYVMNQHGFGLANLIGVLALAYGLILMITSNDKSVRLLSGPTWKFLQRGAYVLWILVAVHTSYFLFMHFVHFHRPLPAPNMLRWPFVVLVLAIFGLRWAATIQTWLMSRQKFNAEPALASPTNPQNAYGN